MGGYCVYHLCNRWVLCDPSLDQLAYAESLIILCEQLLNTGHAVLLSAADNLLQLSNFKTQQPYLANHQIITLRIAGSFSKYFSKSSITIFNFTRDGALCIYC